MLRKTLGTLVCVLLLLLTGCKEVLFAKLTEPQANEVLAALSEARIEAAKTRVDEISWQLEVDDAKIGAALMFLRNRGVPTQHSASLGEVFKKDGMISSPMEERARYAFALQEDIAATLRRIDGVVDARVHLAIPHNDPLATRQLPVSASVLVKYRPTLDIEMVSPNIKSMVTAGVEGLDFRNVTVVALPVGREAAVEAPPVQRTGFISAQAATLTPASAEAPLHVAGADLLAAAMGGLFLSAVGAWWLRRSRGSGSGGDAPRAAPTSMRPRTAVPASAVAVHARAPSAHPGLFDRVDARVVPTKASRR
jgi:type III secretion protein J